MGIVLSLAAGLFFAASTICIRIGMRVRANDDGLFITILVNLVVVGAVAVFVDWPPLSTAGIVALAAGGILGMVLGRASNLRSIRRIGPSRANAFQMASPVVAALAGWLMLGEGVTPLEAVGAVLVIGGLYPIVRRRSTALPVGAGKAGPGAAPAAAPVGRRHPTTAGYAYAVASAVFFGLGFVVKKWGLERFPGAISGALLGAIAAFAVVVMSDAVGGRLPRRIDENFRNIPWMFVLAGLATSAALLSQLSAFAFAPAWVVGLLQGIQVLWTLGLGWLFIRHEERIDGGLVGSILLVVAGVAVISLQV